MTVLAQYFCGRDTGHVFIADSRGGEPSVTTFPLEPLYDELSDYLGKISGEDGSGSGDAGDALRSLVQPIVEHSTEDELVWIVPHGLLHYLPFQAIATAEGFLGFRNPVFYTPSASALPICRRAPRLDGKPVIALGDPTGDLLYARREAQVVARDFGGTLLLDHEATKRGFLDALSQHEELDIVHFACHGSAGAKDPLQAGMLLASDRDDRDSSGEMLTAGEVVRRRLRAGLVTVSACDAGLGQVEGSDEVLGLARSLLYAGAASVLLSSWPVEDLATYFTMERYYAELRGMIHEGRGNKAVALRTAQKYLRDMTVVDVVARCDELAAECADQPDIRGQLRFLEDAAWWVATIGDAEHALSRYRRLKLIADASPTAFADRSDAIQEAIDELEFNVSLPARGADYETRPFARESCWSSFFLHGDWKL